MFEENFWWEGAGENGFVGWVFVGSAKALGF